MNISDGGAKIVSQWALDTGEVINFCINRQTYRARILACDKRFNGFAARAQFIG